MSDPSTGPTPRRGLVLVAMTGSLSMIFVDITVVGVALPEIGRDLGLDEAGLNWVVNAYLLALAAAMAIGGRLGDLLGKVRAFAIGVVLFALASVACGLAADGPQLIVARLLQGLAACLMQPASASLVVEHFAPGERGKAMAVYVGIPMLFMTLGPALGGVVTETLGWPWVFWLNLPVAAATLLLLAAARPRSPRSPDHGVDWFGATMLLAGLPLAVWAIQQAGTADESGTLRATSPAVVAAFAGGVVLLACFVRRQFRVSVPLLRLELLQDRQLLANALLIGLTQFSMAGLVVQGSLYAQRVLGFEPFRAGLSLLPLMVPVLVLVHVAGRRYDRVGVKPVATLGTMLATVGLATQGFGFLSERYAVIGVGMAVLGAGIAFIMSPANTDALGRAPAESRGQISGLVQTFRQLGGTAGVAIAAAISIAVQQTSPDAFTPADPIAAEAATPLPTGSASGDETAVLRIEDDAARAAFARGTAYASFVGAAIMLVGVGLARNMRSERPLDAASPGPSPSPSPNPSQSPSPPEDSP